MFFVFFFLISCGVLFLGFFVLSWWVVENAMNWSEASGDDRSQSPSTSFRRRNLEPRVQDNRHCHSHWCSSSSREGPVTNGHAGSTVKDHYNESRLYVNKDEHFRKLSQFCENLQRESLSKKFRWENLLAKSPAKSISKSSLGLNLVHGCDDGVNRGIGASSTYLGTGSSSKDNNNGDISRSSGIVYETSDVRVHGSPIFQSAGNFDRERRNRTSSHEVQTSQLHSNARFTESKSIWQDGFYEGHHPTCKKEKHREPVEIQLNMEQLMEYKRTQGNHIDIDQQFQDCNQHFKVQPCRRSEIGAALNGSFSQQMVHIPQDDFYQDSMRTSVVMDPVGEGFADTERCVVSHMEETPPSDDYDYFKEVLGSGTGSLLNCEREAAYISSEKLVLAEEDGYRTNYGKWSQEEVGLNGSLVSKHEQGLSDMEHSRKLRWEATNSKKTRVKVTRCGVHSHPGSDSSRKPSVFSRIQFPSHGGEKDVKINLNFSDKRSNDKDITSISLTSTKRPLTWMINHGSQHPKSKRKDLKKRLGITLRDSSSNSNPQVIERERKTNKRLRETNVNHRRLDLQASDCCEEKMQNSSNGSKPEDLVELNNLIKNSFFKFVKVLSESPTRQKKFTEPGSGIIKCIVCGRFVYHH